MIDIVSAAEPPIILDEFDITSDRPKFPQKYLTFS